MRVTWRDSMMFVPWKAVNREDMTFEEWFNAANCFDPHAVDIDIGYQAWSRGHDPTEYAARAQGATWTIKPTARVRSTYSLVGSSSCRQSIAAEKGSLTLPLGSMSKRINLTCTIR